MQFPSNGILKQARVTGLISNKTVLNSVMRQSMSLYSDKRNNPSQEDVIVVNVPKVVDVPMS